MRLLTATALGSVLAAVALPPTASLAQDRPGGAYAPYGGFAQNAPGPAPMTEEEFIRRWSQEFRAGPPSPFGQTVQGPYPTLPGFPPMAGGPGMAMPGQPGQPFAMPPAGPGPEQLAGVLPDSVGVVPASELVGARVVDMSGEPAGSVEFAMIDAQTGDLRYVIVRREPPGSEVVDVPPQLIPVPWSAVDFRPDAGEVWLNMPMSEFRQALALDEARLFELTQPQTIAQIQNLYAVPPDAQARARRGETVPQILVGRRLVTVLAPPAYVSPQSLAGTTVRSADGRVLGEVDQLMIDPRLGEVAYLLLARGGFLGFDRVWVPLPMQALAWSPEAGGYVANVDLRRMQSLPVLTAQELPMRVSTAELRMLYDHFGVQPYWVDDIRMAAQAGAPLNLWAAAPTVQARPGGPQVGVETAAPQPGPVGGEVAAAPTPPTPSPGGPPPAAGEAGAAPTGDQPGVQAQADQQAADARAEQERVRRVRRQDILDFAVRTPEGGQIGEVADLILTDDGRRIEQVVVSLQEQAGGPKQVALPWADVQVSPDADALVADVSAENLQEMEPFAYGEDTNAMVGAQ